MVRITSLGLCTNTGQSKYYIESQFLNDEFAYNKTAHKRISHQ